MNLLQAESQKVKKNKIILVNPGIHFHKPLRFGAYPNTSIMVISSVLYNAGFEVKVVDGKYLTIDDAVKLILSEVEESLAYVGFSVMTIQLPWAYYASKALKAKNPNIFIVWGGVHPSLFPEQTVEDPAVDLAVINDSASTIAPLSKKISQDSDLSTINGICYKSNSHILKTPPNQIKDNFTNVPEINLSLLDHERYSRQNNFAIEEFYGKQYWNCRVYPIIVGLGCSYRCTFCINVIQKKKYCFREAPEIVERIKFLQKNYGADFIHPTDENFFISKKRTFDFLDLLEKENIHIKWRPQARADHFNDSYINVEVAKRLDRAGMIVAAMGVESASQRILDKLKKDLKVEQIIKAAEILSKTNIVTKMNFMVGLPGETESEIEKTFQLAMRIRKIVKRSYITVIPFRPYPGSELYDEIVSEYGYVPPSSLRDWARLSEKELVDSVGYESFDQYKWITNLPRFKIMLYVYDKIAWYRPKLYRRIRSGIATLRLKLNFYAFIFLEKRIFEILSKVKDSLKYRINLILG